MTTTNLQTISLSQEDIDLITFALHRVSKSTNFQSLASDLDNLLQYIEQENKNNNDRQTN